MAEDETVPPVCERLAVNLTERAVRALELAAQVTGLSRTDCVNRSIQLYAWLEGELAAGSTLLIRNADGRLNEARWMLRCSGRGLRCECERELPQAGGCAGAVNLEAAAGTAGGC